MKRLLFFSFFVLVVMSSWAEKKAAILRLDGCSETEQRLIEWFCDTRQGDVLESLGRLDDYSVLWIPLDRVGLGKDTYPGILGGSAIPVIRDWVKRGGNLILTNQATQLVETLGRTSGYAVNIYANGVGGHNPDVWGIQAVIGNVDGQIYDHRSHPVYDGLATSDSYGHEYYPLIGNGNKFDHNCMWDFNAYGSLGANPNKVKDFEEKTNARVIGTWQHVVDYACAGLIEFIPTTEFRGTILANGLAAYDWQAPLETENLKTLSSNMVSYMLTKDSPSCGPVVPVGTKLGMLEFESGQSQTELNAIQWFRSNNIGDIINNTESLSEYKALWIMIDREGLQRGYENLPLSEIDRQRLASWLRHGGQLLLTGHATQLVEGLGRVGSIYAINEFNSGGIIYNEDIWGINAVFDDRRVHMSYTGLDVMSMNGNSGCFPLIRGGQKLNHNCMWNLSAIGKSQADFERDNHAVCLGTWQHMNDYAFPAVVEFLPTDINDGTIIACGIAAYDWQAPTYRNNIHNFTRNMLGYLHQRSYPELEVWTDPTLPKAVSFDMTLSGNTLTESVANADVEINHQLDAYQTDGARDYCVRFDGYSNYVRYLFNTDLMHSRQLTFSLWCAPQMYPSITGLDEAGEAWTSIAGNSDGTTGLAFRISNHGHYSFVCRIGGRTIECRAQNPIKCAEWSHLVATVDTETGWVRLYNNGVEVASSTCASGSKIETGNGLFFIGKDIERRIIESRYYLNTFCGLIDDVELINGINAGIISDNQPENETDFNYDPDRRYAGSLIRPRFHGMPDGNWTNETHGLIYWNGQYHLFFQKNANAPTMCHMQWGHLTSTDLCSWREEKIALMPSLDYDIKGTWSGCIFTDPDFNNGKPTISYTAADFARTSIAMASPLDDNLLDWQKSGQMLPHTPSGFADFRDSYFFTANGQKYMIVGSAKDGRGVATLHRYVNNGWTNNGEIFFASADAASQGAFWEMPAVTKMDDNGNYLFVCTPLGMSTGVKAIYWIGTINMDGTFAPTSGPFDFEMPGTSKNGYGLLSPSICQHDNKTIALGIVPDMVHAYNFEIGWAHNYSLPRELSLSADGRTIMQRPYSGLSVLRSGTKFGKVNITLDNNSLVLGDVKGRHIELLGEFVMNEDNGGDQEQGFRFLKNGNRYAALYYNNGQLTLNLQNMSRRVQDYDTYNGIYTTPISIAKGETLKIQAYIDASIIDVFVNDRSAFSVRLFPEDANAIDAEVYATGNASVRSVNAWSLANGQETESISTNATGTASYVCNHDLCFSDSELEAFVAREVQSQMIVLTKVQSVPAGTPFVVKGAPSSTYDIPIVRSDNLSAENVFSGSLSDTYTVTSAQAVYALSASTGTFMRVKEGVVVPVQKAYLTLPVMSDEAQSRSLTLRFDDSITSVDSHEKANANTVRKTISNNKLYIISRGHEYDAAGAQQR